uniref:Reverse transcriptase Ty1/copia-type domain-containing protein n=1 Tax=Trichuris muris TaxID=70415 RepID=A0A5S6QP09_TRIMR
MQGLEQSNADPCLFARIQKDRKLIIVIYVDEGLVAGTNNEVVDEFLKLLQQEFKITIGSLDCFLGMHIQRQTDGSVFVGQSGYCKRILKKFTTAGANKVSTPCVKATEAEEPLDESVPYRSAVGSLMYSAVATRPDIAFAISTVSQKLDLPTKADWEAVKRLFRYLRGTTDVGILYLPKANPGYLEAYSDADFAGDENTRKSTSGVVCKYSGGTITWLSNKQRITALSTCESEYMAASEAAKEVVWLTGLLKELGVELRKPVLKIDNAGAEKLVLRHL